MNKRLTVSALMALGALTPFATRADMDGDGDAFNQTFFSVRPQFRKVMPMREAGFQDLAGKRDCGWEGAMQFVGFGGRSTNEKAVGRFFSPWAKDSLAVNSAVETILPTGDTFNRTRDIDPRYFNIQYQVDGDNVDYQSTIQFRPRQSFGGLGIVWRNYFGRCDCKDWFFEVSFPIVWVNNDMRLTETGVQTPANAVSVGANANMIEAFRGVGDSIQTLTFGKIDGSQSKTGLADIQVILGYNFMEDDCYSLNTYIGGVIPTSNRPKAEFLFEPIYGNGRHGAVMWGGDFGIELWADECGDRDIWLEFQTNNRWLFRNSQTRSLNVKHRPWSRYMLAYVNPVIGDDTLQLGDAIPAINVLTKKVDVTPRFAHNTLTRFVYDSCGFRGELGYNFWARQTEKVKLKDEFTDQIILAGFQNPAAETDQQVDILNAINHVQPSGAIGIDATTQAALFNQLLVKDSDLDLGSAAMPCAITHTVYGYVGYNWDDLCWPVMVGAGASYEISSVNTALDRWTVFGKIGFAI